MTQNEKAVEVQRIQEAFAKYGMWLFIFYCTLGIAGIAIKHMRALDQKYDIIRRFGLQKIW